MRYTLVPKEKVEDWEKEKLEGWNLVSSTTSYLIYENENWVPMGFTYDSYITEEDFETVSDTNALSLIHILTAEGAGPGEALDVLGDTYWNTVFDFEGQYMAG